MTGSFVNGIRSSVTDTPSPIFDKIWTEQTAPLIIMLFLFPLINLKEFGVIVKFNTLGVLTIIYLLFYIPFVSFYKREIDFKETKQFEDRFFYLGGILTLAFFIHNCILSILKNNRRPGNSHFFVSFRKQRS